MRVEINTEKKNVKYHEATIRVKDEKEWLDAVISHLNLFVPKHRKISPKEKEFLIASVILQYEIPEMYKKEFNYELMEKYGFRSISSIEKHRNRLSKKKWVIKEGHTFSIPDMLDVRNFADEMKMEYTIKKKVKKQD